MGIYVYVRLIHFVIQQKLTHHCKAIYSSKDVKKRKQWGEGKLTNFHNSRCLYCERKAVIQFYKIIPQGRSRRKFCHETSMPVTVT